MTGFSRGVGKYDYLTHKQLETQGCVLRTVANELHFKIMPSCLRIDKYAFIVHPLTKNAFIDIATVLQLCNKNCCSVTTV